MIYISIKSLKWRKQKMCTIQILQLWFVYKSKISLKKKYSLYTSFGKMKLCFLPLSFLPPFHSSLLFVRLPWSAFESIVQEAVVLYVHGNCTVIEQSLLETTLGCSPPKASEQIICTRVLVKYLEFRPPLFQKDLAPYKVCWENVRGNKWPLTPRDPSL